MRAAQIVGNLTRDAELKHLPSGTALMEFSVAVNGRKQVNGEWQDYAHFFDVKMWGERAEKIVGYLTKGKKVGVVGELEHERWQNDAGENRSKVVVKAFDVEFLSPKQDGEGGPAATTHADFPPSAADDDIPF